MLVRDEDTVTINFMYYGQPTYIFSGTRELEVL